MIIVAFLFSLLTGGLLPYDVGGNPPTASVNAGQARTPISAPRHRIVRPMDVGGNPPT